MENKASASKILLVCGVFYPEPVVSARMQTELAMKLSERYEVTVLRPRPTRPKDFSIPVYDYSQFPFKVMEMDSYTCPASRLTGRLKESISHGRWCSRYIRQHHDEIDFIYNDSWHLFGVYLVARAANEYHIPYITPVQDVYPESLTSKLPDFPLLRRIVTKLLLPLDHYSLSHAASVQTNSEKMAAYLSKTRLLDRSHFFVIRNWQDEQEFIDYDRLPNEREIDAPFTFMYMGNVGPLAGIEVLIDAFVQADLKDARLVIAGSGPAKADMQNRAKACSARIEFWDVPTGKVPETQAMADVMLLSVKKGYANYSVPSKLPAYMFSAKPIIASVDDDSDTADCIRESGAGWVVEPEDVSALASAMQLTTLLSKRVLEETGRKGFSYSVQTFSKNRNLARLVQACEIKIH